MWPTESIDNLLSLDWVARLTIDELLSIFWVPSSTRSRALEIERAITVLEARLHSTGIYCIGGLAFTPGTPG